MSTNSVGAYGTALRTISESNILCRKAQFHYRQASCANQHRLRVEFSGAFAEYDDRLLDILREARNGTIQLRRAFSSIQQNSYLDQHFPVLLSLGISVQIKELERISSIDDVSDCLHHEKESLSNNVMGFVHKCNEICIQQQSLLAAVDVQLRSRHKELYVTRNMFLNDHVADESLRPIPSFYRNVSHSHARFWTTKKERPGGGHIVPIHRSYSADSSGLNARKKVVWSRSETKPSIETESMVPDPVRTEAIDEIDKRSGYFLADVTEAVPPIACTMEDEPNKKAQTIKKENRLPTPRKKQKRKPRKKKEVKAQERASTCFDSLDSSFADEESEEGNPNSWLSLALGSRDDFLQKGTGWDPRPEIGDKDTNDRDEKTDELSDRFVNRSYSY